MLEVQKDINSIKERNSNFETENHYLKQELNHLKE